jgi:hypothetical protein
MTAAGGPNLTFACLIEANRSGKCLGNFLGNCDFRIGVIPIKIGVFSVNSMVSGGTAISAEVASVREGLRMRQNTSCRSLLWRPSMASDKEFVKFVCEQLSGAGEISSTRMFGEAAVYLRGKVIGLVPGGHPTSSTCGRVKLLHPDAVNRRRSALS